MWLMLRNVTLEEAIGERNVSEVYATCYVGYENRHAQEEEKATMTRGTGLK
jgi:hypothetical protein